MTNMGRVKISIVKPLGHPVNSWIMIAPPETPPGAMLNGARKMSKLTARIAAPNVNKKYSVNILLRSRFAIIFSIFFFKLSTP
jgi:hypothetical protein